MRPDAPAGISRKMSRQRHNLPSRLTGPTAKVAERLRAHARLCQQIAHESWNEAIASELKRLADDCVAAADNIEADVTPCAPLH
jgi:hypothetical protein